MSRWYCIALAFFLAFSQNGRAQCPFGTPTPEVEKQRIQDYLRTTLISVEYRDTPFHEVIDDLKVLLNVPIVLDTDALAEEQVALDTPLSLKVQEISAKSVLNLLLHDMRLTWVIQDGKLVITTENKARGTLVWRAYSVEDLLTYEGDDVDKDSVEALLHLVVSTVSPRTWADEGGSGMVEYDRKDKVLRVYQTPDDQVQVMELLDVLRHLWENDGD